MTTIYLSNNIELKYNEIGIKDCSFCGKQGFFLFKNGLLKDQFSHQVTICESCVYMFSGLLPKLLTILEEINHQH